MLKVTRIVFAASLAVMMNGVAWSQVADASLRIEISDVRNATGDIGCLIFNGPDGYPESHEKAHRESHVKIMSGAAVCEFKNLIPGEYAAIVFHDENLNGKLDKNFLGIPREGYGASNNVRPAMSAPGFKEAAFGVKAAVRTTITIKMGY
jgi:uncharacterized protein (DUF2141 family)